MAKVIARWHEETFDLLGEPLRLKVKAAAFAEAPDFIPKMEAIGIAAMAQDTSLFSTETASFAGDVFARFVKPAEEIEDEEGRPLKTGADVFSIASPMFVLEVLRSVQRYSMLTAAEGKASGSRSTSAVEAGASGGSPATSIDVEASPSV